MNRIISQALVTPEEAAKNEEIRAQVATEIPRAHAYFECHCNRQGCMYCDGGLQSCTVCRGGEGSLTTECCGRRLTPLEEARIYDAGNLDFRGGKWVTRCNYPRNPIHLPRPDVWWCNVHERLATKETRGMHHCDGRLGGVLLACQCVNLSEMQV